MLIGAAFLFVVSDIGTGATSSFLWFILFRIIGGFGIGIASNVSPVYIAEVAPAPVRGKFVSLNQLTIVVGILLAQIINWQIGLWFESDTQGISADGIAWAWRWMFWMELIPALLFFLFAFLIPESPRWLAIHNQGERSAQILTKIGGESYANQTISELRKLETQETKKENWTALFKPNVRFVVLIGVVLAVFQQWCGINVIFNYAHEIFLAAGYEVSDILMNIVVTGITNLVFTFVAIYTVDKWGRQIGRAHV